MHPKLLLALFDDTPHHTHTNTSSSSSSSSTSTGGLSTSSSSPIASKQRLRVIVTSANFQRHQWNEIGQVIWFQDFYPFTDAHLDFTQLFNLQFSATLSSFICNLLRDMDWPMPSPSSSILAQRAKHAAEAEAKAKAALEVGDIKGAEFATKVAVLAAMDGGDDHITIPLGWGPPELSQRFPIIAADEGEPHHRRRRRRNRHRHHHSNNTNGDATSLVEEKDDDIPLRLMIPCHWPIWSTDRAVDLTEWNDHAEWLRIFAMFDWSTASASLIASIPGLHNICDAKLAPGGIGVMRALISGVQQRMDQSDQYDQHHPARCLFDIVRAHQPLDEAEDAAAVPRTPRTRRSSTPNSRGAGSARARGRGRGRGRGGRQSKSTKSNGDDEDGDDDDEDDTTAPSARCGRVLLIRDRNNVYDGNAIGVHIERNDGQPHHVGYLSRVLTSVLAPLIDFGVIEICNDGTTTLKCSSPTERTTFTSWRLAAQRKLELTFSYKAGKNWQRALMEHALTLVRDTSNDTMTNNAASTTSLSATAPAKYDGHSSKINDGIALVSFVGENKRVTPMGTPTSSSARGGRDGRGGRGGKVRGGAGDQIRQRITKRTLISCFRCLIRWNCQLFGSRQLDSLLAPTRYWPHSEETGLFAQSSSLGYYHNDSFEGWIDEFAHFCRSPGCLSNPVYDNDADDALPTGLKQMQIIYPTYDQIKMVILTSPPYIL
jgi:hypothetical protein